MVSQGQFASDIWNNVACAKGSEWQAVGGICTFSGIPPVAVMFYLGEIVVGLYCSIHFNFEYTYERPTHWVI